MWSLLFHVVKRISEEPIGIIFAILVFFVLRLPSQISDMLAPIVICTADGCSAPQSLPAFFGYLICATILACTVWFWLSAVNRCEIAIRGGRLDDYLDENGRVVCTLNNPRLPFSVMPYRMAAATSSSMIFLSCLAAASGFSMESVFGTGLILLGVDFAVLICFSLGLGYTIAAMTGDGWGREPLTQRDALRLRNFEELRSMRDTFGWFKPWHAHLRIQLLSAACNLLGLGFFAFAGMLAASVFGLLAIASHGLAMEWNEVRYTQFAFILFAIVALFIYNVFDAWLGYVLFKASGQKADDPYDFSHRKRSYMGIFLAVLMLATTMFLIAAQTLGERNFSELFRTPPSVVLLAMACVVGPLVVFLTILRDLFERVFQVIGIVVSKLIGSEVPDLEDRPHGARHPLRGLGRQTAVLAMAYALFSGFFDEVASPDCTGIDGYNTPAECSLYMVERKTLPDPRSVERPALTEALNSWRATRFPGDDPQEEIPLLIVAASGGASRAAAWTLTVLDDIESATTDDFAPSRHIFAMSSVSGGSLGAVTYALNAANGRSQVSTRHIANLAKADLLTAPASQFPVDLLRRVPVLANMLSDWDDRNQALEKRFINHWQTGWSIKASLVGENFLQALSPARALEPKQMACERNCPPHLLINGVDVKSGRRILTSTIDFSQPGATIPNALDFFDEFRGDISIPAAVMNSARFPLISPAGRYTAHANVGGRRDLIERQIIDGGYYENNGVETALAVIKQIETLYDAGELTFKPLPALLLITNSAVAQPVAGVCLNSDENGTSVTTIDPPAQTKSAAHNRLFHVETLTCEDQSVNGLTAAADRAGKNSRVPELFAPIAGLFGIRDSHGTQALLEAQNMLCRAPEDLLPGQIPPNRFDTDRFFHIGLHKPVCDNQSAPLNWVLTQEVADFLTEVAIHDPHVQWQIMKLTNFLTATTR